MGVGVGVTTGAGAGAGADGVTALDALDAALVPPLLVAVTVNVYGVPFVKPDTTHERAAASADVHVNPPGLLVAV